jgi:transmembrane sensor
MRRPGPRSGPFEGRPEDVAARWLARRDGERTSQEDEAAFRRWLSLDVSHEVAYARAVEALAATARHAAAPEIVALREAALTLPAHRSPAGWRIGAIAAGLVVACGLGLGTLAGYGGLPGASPAMSTIARALTPPEKATYRTAIGERLTFTLPDGSVATLNTNSVLKVDYRRGERRVRLLHGQALFQVAKNPNLPFRVYAGDRRITALGTLFDVRLEGREVKVALIEGSVRVAQIATPATAEKPPEQVVMTAGEVLTAAPAAPMRVKSADTEQAASWRSGVVVFEDRPLVEAVREINRYTTRPLSVGDSAAGYRVSGVFKTGEPERFAAAMTEIFPLEADRADDGSVTLRQRN